MEDFYEQVTNSFSKLKKKPKSYSTPNVKLSEDIKQCMKDLYDFSIRQHEVPSNSKMLPELIIENFDAEQIWQQIELRNSFVLDQSVLKISKLLAETHKLSLKKSEKDVPNQESEEDTDDGDENKPDDQPELDNAGEPDQDDHDNVDESDNQLDDAQESDLEDMNGIDKRSEKSKQLDPNQDDEDSVDMFDDEDNGKDDESDNDDDSDNEDVADIIFEPEKNANDKFFEEDQVYSDEEEIRELEENAVKEKSWQMKGEVTCEDRPAYSLLEHNLEVDISRKPPPVITEGTTLRLEEIIKQRIKDKAFDSVERKAKPVENPLEYKKKLVLDQEKSKLSLAQIYENQFINQEQSMDPNHEQQEEEPELHTEIKKMMSQLFAKLDALGNYHFTPKPSVPELKVISNLPAVLMEEVVPITTSDATLLAPEEIKGKAKGDLLGKSERTSSDKKRERRKKKLKQKVHAKEHQKSKVSAVSGANIMKVKDKPKVKKSKKGAEQDPTSNNKVIRSSTAFFDQLEDEIHTQKKNRIKSKRQDVEKFNPKRMKL